MSRRDRYALDPTPPTRSSARSDLLRRAVAPAGAVWLVVVALGLLITGPLDELPGEEAVNEALQDRRSPLLDTLTQVWSNIGGTHGVVLGCIAVIALVWWRTRQWWLAVVPGLAATIQSAVFLTSSLVVGRPRPEVEHLDHAPPTTSFPSGHTGASTAFYLTCLVLARRLPHPAVRYIAMVLCGAVPLLVGFARLYRGMHHTTDVLVGLLNGIACAWLAWHYLRRDPDPGVEPDGAAGLRHDDAAEPAGVSAPASVGGPATTEPAASGLSQQPGRRRPTTGGRGSRGT